MLCVRLAGVALMAAGAITACKSDRPSTGSETATPTPGGSPSATLGTVTVTAKDYGYDAPATIPAGAVTMQLENHGKELHQAQLIKLEDGKTVADLEKALKNPGPPPSWMKFMGGPNGIAPGARANATQILTPGNYVYICYIPSPDGVMHAAKGMVRPFEVTAGSTPAAAELPPGDVTIKLSDYAFDLSRPLTPGRRTIMVENAGPQPHELVMLKLAPGKTAEDFGHWAETGMKGPPPAEPIGGVTILDKGGRGSFTADLTAGDYGLICFVPDAKTGKLHLAHGMTRTIKVS